MSEKRLGIIMHGVTGRMGANQHLARSIAAIREQGGVRLADGTRIMPDPILVGRRPDALRETIRSLEGALPDGAWPVLALDNHDRSRLATRLGRAHGPVTGGDLLAGLADEGAVAHLGQRRAQIVDVWRLIRADARDERGRFLLHGRSPGSDKRRL